MVRFEKKKKRINLLYSCGYLEIFYIEQRSLEILADSFVLADAMEGILSRFSRILLRFHG